MGEKMEKQVLFNLGYGLYVLTANYNGKDNGCIINTVMQVRDTPATIIIGVNKENYTNEMIEKTLQFNVSIISEGAGYELFKHFGFQSGKNVEKFQDYKYAKRADNDIYYITENTNSYLSAKVIETIDAGTHNLFLAEVTVSKVLSNEKTMTYDYYHEKVKNQDDADTDNKTEKEESTKKYLCEVCGYIYEGEELPADFICPWCKHGIDAFVQL